MNTTIEPHPEQQPEPEKKQKKRDRRGFEPRPGHVVQAFVFALDPGARTEQRSRSHCGAARVAYAWAISHVLASWEQRRAEASYDIAEDDLTPWRSWSLPSLRKAFNTTKHTDPRFAGWWTENPKEAYNTGLASAAAAFDAYTQSKRGERQGPGWASRGVSPSTAPCWPAGSPPGPSGWRANLREDAIHQLTTSLAREYGTVVVEDLNVAGTVKTGVWPDISPTPVSAGSAASWTTGPPGVVGG